MKCFNNILKILITILMVTMSANITHSQVYEWSKLGNGVDGNVNAITYLNGRFIVAGGFSHAGGVPVNNIAQWDGSGWSALGSGFDDTVYALTIFNGDIYAGGRFLHSGTDNLNHIAYWTGSNWSQVGFTGNGTDGEVRALTVYHGNLLVGGKFFNAGNLNMSHVAKWTGAFWQPLGSSSSNGLNNDVYAFTVNNDSLIVGGSFTSTNQALLNVNRIALWDEANWYNLGTGLDGNVYALTVWNGNIYAGGSFSNAGGTYSPHLAYWNGSSWLAFTNQPPDDNIYTLCVLNNQLIAGGNFKNIGTPSIYGSRIAKWNGSSWSRLITGMNNTVNTFFIKDSSLYAGGNFTTAGGDFINHISVWNSLSTFTISGLIRYADSLTIVHHGEVFAVRLDVATREIIKVDSTTIDSSNGSYSLTHVPPGDSLYIMSFPNDAYPDYFVPTYHPSTIDWESAVKVYPNGNLTNVNVNVIRVIPEPGPNFATGYNISGYVHLNYTPPFTPIPGYPFSSGAIVYAKQGTIYRGFGITDINEYYTIYNMAPGTYDLFANRLGYKSGVRTITLGNVNYDTANFWLDTAGPIGVRKISSSVPKQYMLYQNYPNPFNPATIIRFDVPKEGISAFTSVRLSVFNLLGQEIAVLVNDKLQPGEYKTTFNSGSIASGVYFYRLEAGAYNETRKMLLIK